MIFMTRRANIGSLRVRNESACLIDDDDLDVRLGDGFGATVLIVDDRHLTKDAAGGDGLGEPAAQR